VSTSSQGEDTQGIRDLSQVVVEKFCDHYWRRISAVEARTWLVGYGVAGGPAGMHSLYRTVRAFVGKIRLVHQDPSGL
jgi:hypothetical protein